MPKVATLARINSLFILKLIGRKRLVKACDQLKPTLKVEKMYVK